MQRGDDGWPPSVAKLTEQPRSLHGYGGNRVKCRIGE